MPPKKLVIKADGTPDFRMLENVMSSQLEADAKYDRENDAKFRAVKQKVATYEEFENIVLGAHLQPMEEDILALDLKKTAGSASTGRARERERERMKQTAAPMPEAPTTFTPPQSSQEFTRIWRGLKSEPSRRCQYLLATGPKLLGQFFSSGADAILGDALVALAAGYQPEDAGAVLAVLDALAQTPRFGLTLEFLSDTERKAGTDVIARIASGVGAPAADGEKAVKEAEAPADEAVMDAAALDGDLVAKLQTLFV